MRTTNQATEKGTWEGRAEQRWLENRKILPRQLCRGKTNTTPSVYKLISWYIIDSTFTITMTATASCPSDRLGRTDGRSIVHLLEFSLNRTANRKSKQKEKSTWRTLERSIYSTPSSSSSTQSRPRLMPTDHSCPISGNFHTAIRRDSILNSNQKFAATSATCGLFISSHIFSGIRRRAAAVAIHQPLCSTAAHYNPSESYSG